MISTAVRTEYGGSIRTAQTVWIKLDNVRRSYLRVLTKCTASARL
ncbi:MAG: hypothetical protein ACTS6G_04890 [Candidatus Hodgkinia cicadicola]